jgi:hypothetical protein
MQPSIHNETECNYISTCGLSLICSQPPTYYGRQLKYSWNVNNEKGDTIYTHCRNLAELVKHAHMFKQPFIIVVNGDDNLLPTDYPQETIKTIIESQNILAIYSQNNCITTHPKCIHLPIGMDYHTLNWEGGNHLWGRTGMNAKQQEALLEACKTKMKPIQECCATPILTNFQLAMDSPPRRQMLRKPIYEALQSSKWMKWLPEMSRKDFWLRLSDVAFVLCAPGNGFDTHRAWEALLLQKIPIVQKLPINEVYKGLPIWEVEDWNAFAALSEEDIAKKHKEFCDKWDTYEWERLTLDFWRKVFASYKL